MKRFAALIAVLFFATISNSAFADIDRGYTPIRDCDTSLWLIGKTYDLAVKWDAGAWMALDPEILKRHPESTQLQITRGINAVDQLVEAGRKAGFTKAQIQADFTRQYHC